MEKMYTVKDSWMELSDISDRHIVDYPLLCDTTNSGLKDFDNGMEYYADSITGIQYFLGIKAKSDCEITISYVVDATDMELVFISADGTVEHFTSGESENTTLTVTKGENAFGVIGFKGSGTVSVQIESDNVTIDKMLLFKLTWELF